MLRLLQIQRLAIIDSVSVEFDDGLNVITGETGAGKSIVVGAIDLLLGGRASAELVRTGAASASVQALIENIENKELIVRREVADSGRSRAFIDDTLVTVNALRQTMTSLVDLHGQHEHQTLLDPGQHLDLLDRFARLEDERAAVSRSYDELIRCRESFEALTLDQRERAERLEALSFDLAEITRVSPMPGEDDTLLEERRILQNADRLARLAGEAYRELYEADHAAMGRLAVVWRRIADLAEVDPRFEPYRGLADATMPALEDLALTLRRYCGSIDASPERLQAVEDRLAALERVKRRHGPTLADVQEKAQRLQAEIAGLQSADQRRAELQHTLSAAEQQYVERASRLSERRRQASAELCRRLEQELHGLAMQKSRCAFQIERQANQPVRWGRGGFDRGELLISVNPGEQLRPLVRVASGGELSRIMLALKGLVAVDPPGKTLVFDEVDAGISGRVADTVGRKLRKLAERYQVICITHLPQVAAHATTHFRVDKRLAGGRTVVSVKRLTEEERVDELATLLAGRDVTASARSTAWDMLRAAGQGESKATSKGESESG